MDVNFEQEDLAQLNTMLKRFYAEARDQKGEKYSYNTMKSLRAGINRHLQQPPYNRSMDICKDKDFKSANQVYDGYLKLDKIEGKDVTKHKTMITDADWSKLQNSELLNISSPTTLQNKVFVNILTHFGRMGREGLREMTKKSFDQHVDDDGHKYYMKTINECTKKNDLSATGKSKDVDYNKCRMLEQKGDPRCPVASFEKYLGHLNPECGFLFPFGLDHVNYQKKGWKEDDKVWYSTHPIGQNNLGNKIKALSKQVGLSKVYTNDCIRASLTTKLCQKGVEVMTGHKNVSSILQYADETRPTVCEDAKLNSMLHDDGPTAKRAKNQVQSLPPSAHVPLYIVKSM